MVLAISARVGFGLRSSSHFARSAKPGVQKPHCTPAAAANARPNSARSASGTPSQVRMVAPSAFCAGTAQVVLGLPSTSARQQPHCAWGAQPSLVETTPQRSRSVSSSVSPGAISTRCPTPLSEKAISATCSV